MEVNRVVMLRSLELNLIFYYILISQFPRFKRTRIMNIQVTKALTVAILIIYLKGITVLIKS